MKTLTYKDKDGSIHFHSSGCVYQHKPGKKWKKLEQTESEQEQAVCESLIDDVRRRDFDKNLLSLITNFIGKEVERDFDRIHLRIEGCDMEYNLYLYNNKKMLEGVFAQINEVRDKLNKE